MIKIEKPRTIAGQLLEMPIGESTIISYSEHGIRPASMNAAITRLSGRAKFTTSVKGLNGDAIKITRIG